MAVYPVEPKPGDITARKWKVEKFAEIGWDETFVRHVTELRDRPERNSDRRQQREDVNHAIMNLVWARCERSQNLKRSGCSMASNCRSWIDASFIMTSAKLWKAYKDLTQRAATRWASILDFWLRMTRSSQTVSRNSGRITRTCALNWVNLSRKSGSLAEPTRQVSEHLSGAPR